MATGKALDAGARRDMRTSNPSTASARHSPSTIARVISLPSGPNSSHAGGNVVVGWVGWGRRDRSSQLGRDGRTNRKDHRELRTTEISATRGTREHFEAETMSSSRAASSGMHARHEYAAQN